MLIFDIYVLFVPLGFLLTTLISAAALKMLIARGELLTEKRFLGCPAGGSIYTIGLEMNAK